ncbi:MAG: hypothetical protein R2744_12155 [Bacteroidales bacterium]
MADYWNQGIHENYDVLNEFKPDKEMTERKAGFGAVVTFKNNGIAKGASALVTLNDDKANRVVKERTTASYSFNRGISEDAFPQREVQCVSPCSGRCTWMQSGMRSRIFMLTMPWRLWIEKHDLCPRYSRYAISTRF